jgi:hypothetical protein
MYLLQDIVDNSDVVAEFEDDVTITIPKELWEQLMEATK